jgi:hypothetical protein
MRGVVGGILQGTREAEDVLEAFADIGVSIFADMFARTIEQKLSWEATLSGNLLHDLPALFSQSGLLAGGSFISSVIGGVGKAGGIGAIVGALTGSTGAGVGGALGSLAGSFGFLASELSAVGVGLGTSLASGFGIGINAALSIGGAVSSLILPGVGILAGFLVEELFGALFAHTPTAGTQIRKGVVEWLKEIEVSFADEVNSKNYFFEETKRLAEQLGTNFLDASQQILTEKAGPELAQQLQALGTFITADSAQELGKSLEQTGATFGNLLIANLGIDQIPAAIDEIVEKSGISFAGLVEKLNSVFQQGAISSEFYQNAIQGAIDLFTSDLPAAIDVSAIALESFTDEGIFSLEEFQAKLEQSVTNFEILGGAAATAITDAMADGILEDNEVKDAFEELVRQALFDAALQQLLTTQLSALFKDIDLTQPIDLNSEAMQGFAEKVDLVGQNIFAILKAMGLLPPLIDEAAAGMDRFARGAIEASAALEQATALSQSLTDQLTHDILSGVSVDVAAADFLTAMRRGVAEAIVGGIVEGLTQGILIEQVLAPIFQHIGFLMQEFLAGEITAEQLFGWVDDLFETVDPQVQKFFDGLETIDPVIRKWLEAWGLLTEEIDDSTDAVKKWGEAIDEAGKDLGLTWEDPFPQDIIQSGREFSAEFKQVAAEFAEELSQQVESGLTAGVIDALMQGGADAAIAQLHDNLYQSVYNAVVTALLDALVVQVLMPLLDPLFATIGTATTAFLDPTSEHFMDWTWLAGVISTEFGKIPGILAEADPIFQAWANAALGIGESLGLTSSGASPSATGGGGGHPGVGEVSLQEGQGPEAIEAQEQFIESLHELTDEINSFVSQTADLADQLAQINEEAAQLIHELVNMDVTLTVTDEFTGLPEAITKTIQEAIDAVNYHLTAAAAVGLVPPGTQLTIEDFADLEAFLQDLPADVAILIAQEFALLEIALREQGSSLQQIAEHVKAINESAAQQQQQAVEDFLSPVNDFINAGREVDEAIGDLTDTFHDLTNEVLANAATLEAQGVDVDALLADLEASFATQMVDVVTDTFGDFIEAGEATADVFGEVIDEYNALVATLQEGAADLEAAGIDVDAIFTDLTQSLNAQLVALADETFGEFIDAGLGVQDAFQSLTQEFTDLVAILNANAAALQAAGVDTNAILSDLTASLNAQMQTLADETFGDFIAAGQQAEDEFQQLTAEFNKLVATLNANAAALQAAAVDTNAILSDLTASLNVQMRQLAEETFSGFIEEGLGAQDDMGQLIEEFNTLVVTLTANAAAMQAAGVDTAKLLADLTASLNAQLNALLQDSIAGFVRAGQGAQDVFNELTTEYQELTASIHAHTAELAAAGVDVSATLVQLTASLNAQVRALVDETFGTFIETGLSAQDALTSLIDEFNRLVLILQTNAALLQQAGVNIDAVFQDLAASLLAQIEKLWNQVLDPFDRAIEQIAGAQVTAFPDLIAQIGNAQSLEELQRISQEAIQSTLAAAAAAKELAQEQATAAIAELEARRDEEITAIQDHIAATDELIQAREEELNETTRAAEQLRDVAKSLRDAFEDIQFAMLPLQQRVAAVQHTFLEFVTAAQGGDLEAAQQLPSLINQLEQMRIEILDVEIQALQEQLDLVHEQRQEIEEARRGVEQLRDAAQSLREAAAGNLVGGQSFLLPQDQIAELQKQILEAQALALGGDTEAAQSLPGLVNALNDLARETFASGQPAQDLFAFGQNILTSTATALEQLADSQEQQLTEQEQALNLQQAQLEQQVQQLEALKGIEQGVAQGTAAAINQANAISALIASTLGSLATQFEREAAALDHEASLLQATVDGLVELKESLTDEIDTLSTAYQDSIEAIQHTLQEQLALIDDATVYELIALRTAVNDQFAALATALAPTQLTHAIEDLRKEHSGKFDELEGEVRERLRAVIGEQGLTTGAIQAVADQFPALLDSIAGAISKPFEKPIVIRPEIPPPPPDPVANGTLLAAITVTNTVLGQMAINDVAIGNLQNQLIADTHRGLLAALNVGNVNYVNGVNATNTLVADNSRYTVDSGAATNTILADGFASLNTQIATTNMVLASLPVYLTPFGTVAAKLEAWQNALATRLAPLVELQSHIHAIRGIQETMSPSVAKLQALHSEFLAVRAILDAMKVDQGQLRIDVQATNNSIVERFNLQTLAPIPAGISAMVGELQAIKTDLGQLRIDVQATNNSVMRQQLNQTLNIQGVETKQALAQFTVQTALKDMAATGEVTVKVGGVEGVLLVK